MSNTVKFPDLTVSANRSRLLDMNYPRWLWLTMGLLSFQPHFSQLSLNLFCQPAFAAERMDDAPAPQDDEEPTALEAAPADAPHGVYSETQDFSPEIKTALESLLFEHEKLTGQQIVIGLFKNAHGEDVSNWAQRKFNDWKIGMQTAEENGILIALFTEEKKASIAVGYGLDSTLPEATVDEIIEQAVEPVLQTKGLGEAAVQATYKTLEALDSPLISSGKAEEILEQFHIMSPSRAVSAAQDAQARWFLLALTVFFLMISSIWMGLKVRRSGGWREVSQRLLPMRFQKQMIFSKDIMKGSSGTLSDEGSTSLNGSSRSSEK